MTCENRLLQLNALVDDEVSPEAETELLQHLAVCPVCAAEFAGLLTLKRKLTRLVPVEAPDLARSQRIEMAWNQTSQGSQLVPAWQVPLRTLMRPALLGGMIGLALTLLIGHIMRVSPPKEPALPGVADAGLREDVSARNLILARDRPGGANAWFARHHLAQLPLPDLTAAGFRLVGCRTDIVAGHMASIVVYRQNGIKITLMAWPSKGEPERRLQSAQVGKQTISYWNDGRLEFWVSGGRMAPVHEFTTAYRMKL